MILERIQGLSIGLDLDTLRVERGLTGLKDSMKTLNSELKAGLSAFDRADKSVEKYETTLNSLNKKLELQKSITVEVAKEYDKMVAEYGEGSKEAEKAARAYNNQVAVLNNLQRSVERTKSDLEDLKEEQRIASSNWTKLGDTAEKAGNKLTGIGEGVKGLGERMSMSITAPLLAGFAAVTKGTEELRGELALLDTNASVQGFNVGGMREELEKINAIAPDVNANVEGLSNLMATPLSQQGLSEAVDLLSGAAIKFSETLKFEGMADGLQETLAVGEAVGPFAELLERSGVSLDDFNEGLTKAIKSGNEENYVLKTLADTGLADVNQEFRQNNEDLIKSRESSLSFQTAMAELGATLTPIATKITESITGVVEKFNNLDSGTQKAILSFAGIGVVLGPVITVVGSFITGIGKISGAFGTVMKSIAKAGGLLKWIRTGLMALTGPVGLTIGAITLLTTGFIALYKRSETFRTGVNNLLSGIKTFAKDAVEGFKTFWNKTSEVFKNLYKKVTEVLTNVVSDGKALPGRIGSAITSMASKTVNAAKNMASRAKEGISNWWSTVVSNAKALPGRMADAIRNMASKVATAARNMATTAKEKVAGVWSDIVQGAKDLPGKMGDGIKKMASKVTDGVRSVANAMTRMLGKGVNGVIDGVNWVLDKVGVDSRIGDWEVPQYAKGTDGHPGGLAIVGDGKGSNAGKELIQTPDGKQFLSPDKPSLVNLPKGTHVLPALLTKQLFDIPMYGWGTLKGWVSDKWQKGKKVASKIKDSALDVWEYISNPSKLFNKALEAFGVKTPSFPGVLKDMGVGLFNKAKEALKGFLKGKIENFGLGDVPTAGSGVQRWAGLATRALAMTGQYTKANLERLLYQMQTESNGNPRAINLWDINAKRGTPSKGLMQVIDPTFRAYAMPGFHTNIWDPLSNMLASIRYAVSRYGSLAAAYRGVGYETGGLINKDGLYRLAEGGHPEFVIPTDPSRRTDAMKLLALAGKKIAGNKRPNQLPGVSSGNGSLEAVINRLDQQVQLLTQLVLSTQKIEKKPVISEGDIGRAAERYDAKQSAKHSVYTGRFAY